MRMNRFGSLALSLLCGLAALLVMGRTAAQDEGAPYPPVVEGQALHFPRDFGAHPAFRTEWWYITGWLYEENGAEDGRESVSPDRSADALGFQLTFFRVRTRIGDDNPSRFAPRQLILAHAALADPRHGRLRHAERSARAYPGLAGAAEGRTAVELDDWFLHGGDAEDASYRSRIRADDFAFELEFVPDRPPLANGRGGFSQKAPDPINASYYYSRPQLAVRGILEVDGRSRMVQGSAWLDHEWSSEILPAAASGWDWIGINLHDGGSLMLFQMRSRNGDALWAAGTHVDGGGVRTVFPPTALAFEALRHWRSPRTGIEYPVQWRIELDDGRGARRELLLQPLMDDQELDSRLSTGAVYWEGAVRLLEAEREIGRGYLEMTGYGEPLNM